MERATNTLLLPTLNDMKLTIACHLLLLAVTAGIAHAAAAPTTTDAWEPAPFMEEVSIYRDMICYSSMWIRKTKVGLPLWRTIVVI